MKLVDTQAFIGINDNFFIDGRLVNLRNNKEEHATKYDIKYIAVLAQETLESSIYEYIREASDMLIGAYLQIVPEDNPYWKKNDHIAIHKLIKKGGISGLKFSSWMFPHYSINDERLFPYFDIAQINNIPLLTHCSNTNNSQTMPNKAQQVADKFPSLNIILAHYGGNNTKYVADTQELVKKNKNIYLNITGLSGELKRLGIINNQLGIVEQRFSQVEADYWKDVIKKSMDDPILSERILFGSDFPYLNFGNHLKLIESLEMDKQQKFYSNARRVFNF